MIIQWIVKGPLKLICQGSEVYYQGIYLTRYTYLKKQQDQEIFMKCIHVHGSTFGGKVLN